MVEVFKTTINTTGEAMIMAKLIEKEFKDHEANFDLEDCDRILRVESRTGRVDSNTIISLFSYFGFEIRILPDDILPLTINTQQFHGNIHS